MEIKTLTEVQVESAGQGMGEYHLNILTALTAFEEPLKELALMLKEFGYMHESAEHILSLMLIIDQVQDAWSYDA
jgi:hypothetical protein